MIKIGAGFLFMMSCTVVANLLVKANASLDADRLLFGFLGWRTAVGLAFFGLAFVIYTWLLRWIPLNVAQSLGALQYVGIILASTWVLAEPIPPARWLGIALITGGIVVVGLTTRIGN